MSWAYPLGLLATDHVGYLSFDLLRLPPEIRKAVQEAVEARRLNPATQLESAIWLYPMASDEFRIDALANGSFAVDAIVVRIHLPGPDLPAVIRNLGLLALQNPSLTDWRISPGSFAGNPGALLGADGCETLMPANLALQEFHFYQVIAFPRREGDDIPAGVRLGIVHEYRVAWYHLGHSLGEILYSLPLAPGESVNLAVIDWTRRDDAQRKENTTLDEQIVHDEHRDRGVSETVNAAVSEYQHGSSFMGGIAESGGVSGTMGAFGLAAGVAGSLGGSTANSSGSRKIAATTVQNISDNITQASAARRELQSTVVVHTNESEKEAIETRTIANYNHSHALTILYYEVLRHFRVLTEFVRQGPAVLLRLKADWFIGTEEEVDKNVQEHRAALQAALLDASLADAFDALDRIERRRAAPPSSLPAEKFVFFEFDMLTGDIVLNDGQKIAIDNVTLWPANKQLISGGQLNPPGGFLDKDQNVKFAAGFPGGVNASDIDQIELRIDLQRTGRSGPDLALQRIKITGVNPYGKRVTLVDYNYAADGGELRIGETATLCLPVLEIARPQPAPPRPAEEIDDAVKRARLVAHLEYHKEYYSRAILFQQNPTDRAIDLESSGIADRIENRPLEVIGGYVAYPCTDITWGEKVERYVAGERDNIPPPDERLVTLPVRGVFAEAKLGHCNASEEIDNTRFWDWQQSPIPHLAPEIAPIQRAVAREGLF